MANKLSVEGPHLTGIAMCDPKLMRVDGTLFHEPDKLALVVEPILDVCWSACPRLLCAQPDPSCCCPISNYQHGWTSLHDSMVSGEMIELHG